MTILSLCAPIALTDAEYRISTGSPEGRTEKLSALGWQMHIQRASRAAANAKTFAVGLLFRKLEASVGRKRHDWPQRWRTRWNTNSEQTQMEQLNKRWLAMKWKFCPCLSLCSYISVTLIHLSYSLWLCDEAKIKRDVASSITQYNDAGFIHSSIFSDTMNRGKKTSHSRSNFTKGSHKRMLQKCAVS